MRAIVLAALVMAGPAWGQTSYTQQAILVWADAQKAVAMAALCGLRSTAWFTFTNALTLDRMYQAAQNGITDFDGDRRAAGMFIDGATMQAKADARREFERYGQAACRDLQSSKVLQQLDNMKP